MTFELAIDRGGYGRTQVLDGVHVSLAPGEVVALLGSNGAGKSTTLRIAAGLVPIESGSLRLGSLDMARMPAEARARHGIAHVPEGRQLFPTMTVEDNLRLGAFCCRRQTSAGLAEVYELFPVLSERARQHAGSLSGGQAQMLAIGRALMSRPKYMLMDEPSLGLAPLLVHRVLDTVRSLADGGMAVLLAEQNAAAALSIADRAYVLERGRLVLTGTGEELLHDQRVADAFLGGSAG